MNDITAIDKFLRYLSLEKGLSENTISSYLLDLRKLSGFLSSRDKTLLAATTSDISEFFANEKKLKITARSRARALSTFKHFYRFITDKIPDMTNPAYRIESARLDHKLPDFLTEKEINTLLDSIPEFTTLGIRDRALFELLYSSGMRISEAISIKIQDIDFENSMIEVIGKGNKPRIILLCDQAISMLKKYLQERPKIYGTRGSEFLFTSMKTGRLERKSVNKLIAMYAARVGIKKNITPHTLRHSFASHMLEAGADLRSIQELLGHSSINSTEIYTHIAPAKLQEIHKKYHS